MSREGLSKEWKRELLSRARKMRREPTPAEAVLWEALRKGKHRGLRFRRQFIIEPYIVDFYCHKAKVVIEIDGGVHNTQEEFDQKREDDLQSMGYRIIRFSNHDVIHHLEKILYRINIACQQE